MRRLLIAIASSFIATSAGLSATAQTEPIIGAAMPSPFTVGLHVSSMGFGGHFSKYLAPNLEAYGTLDYFKYGQTHIEGDSEIDLSIGGLTGSANIAWHPGGTPLRVSAGLVAGGPAVRANLSVEDSGAFSNEPIRINGDLKYGAGSPVGVYLGVGFSRGFRSYDKVSLFGDLGFTYMGKVTLSGTVTANCAGLSSPADQQDCEQQVDQVNADLDSFSDAFDQPYLYPTARLGLSFKF